MSGGAGQLSASSGPGVGGPKPPHRLSSAKGGPRPRPPRTCSSVCCRGWLLVLVRVAPVRFIFRMLFEVCIRTKCSHVDKQRVDVVPTTQQSKCTLRQAC
jgi:hypothetical protein